MNDENDVLLLDEPSLQVQPKLAIALGLNQALFLQQVQYWLYMNKKAGKNLRDGRYWTYNTFENWQRTNFPFWSVSTLKRIVAKLEKAGVLVTTDKYNKVGYDNTKWYSIDRAQLAEVVASGELSEGTMQDAQADVQIDTAGYAEQEPPCQSDTSIVSTWHVPRVTLARPIPETNAETNAETTRDAAPLRSTALSKPSKHKGRVEVPASVDEAVRGATAKAAVSRKKKPTRAAPTNANTAVAHFASQFTETFGGIAPLELAKDRALMKKMVDHYGYEEVTRYMDWMFRHWAQFRRECKVTGVPTVGMFFGFRGYLQEHAGTMEEEDSQTASVWGV